MIEPSPSFTIQLICLAVTGVCALVSFGAAISTWRSYRRIKKMREESYGRRR